jgi:hypothetical protein
MRDCRLTYLPVVLAGARSRLKPRWLCPLLAVPLIIILAYPGTLSAQQTVAGTQGGTPIDDMTKAAIIDSLSKALNDIYVFPDVAKQMEKKMRADLRRHVYRDITTYEEFTARLTEDLLETSHDRHLRVNYSPEPPAGLVEEDSLTEDAQRRMVEQFARTNFGFVKLERLAGNVGYLDLRGFHDAAWAGKTAVAAMNFLANSDAIIIDLRKNGGGQPSMIQLISSYFFEEPVHLNSFYIRDEDTMHQFWSHAHVEGPRMADTPLYVLTSSNTFSGAEEFTYNMKNLERATIIGETTGGGAHPVRLVRFADLGISVALPFGRAVNPITGTNWEGTGVEPHIEVAPERALEVAHLEALTLLANRAPDEERRRELEWAIGGAEALIDPPAPDPDLLKTYAGVYGPRKIAYQDRVLYYQREGNARMKMIPMSDNTFMFDEIDFFRVEIGTDEAGSPTCIIGHYANGFTDRTPRSAD